MNYAKLINNDILQFAPNPILVDGNWIGNPPGSIYEAKGYKVVVYNDPPGEPDEGYDWAETWEETSEAIVQGWELVPVPDDVDPAEAMEILFGSDEE